MYKSLSAKSGAGVKHAVVKEDIGNAIFDTSRVTNVLITMKSYFVLHYFYLFGSLFAELYLLGNFPCINCFIL